MGISGLLVLLLAVAARAQSPAANQQAGDVQETVTGTLELQKQTQQKRDAWAQERADLTARFRAAKANVEYLVARREVDERKLAALEANVATMERNLSESLRLEASVQDTLDAITTRLAGVVERDLPFLKQEREARIAALRAELARPDVTSAEKLRRLLEVLQVEAGYGNGLELTQEQIEVNGERIFVDLLRVGRLSLFWRTSDGKRVGEYDCGAGRWTELPSRHSRAIRDAMEMASRMRPVEIIALPLGRIEP